MTRLTAVTMLGSLGALAIGCAGNPRSEAIASFECGVRVSSDATSRIGVLYSSFALEGDSADQGLAPGQSLRFVVPCRVDCVIVQGRGIEAASGNPTFFQGVAEARPGRYEHLQLRQRESLRDIRQEAQERGCELG